MKVLSRWLLMPSQQRRIGMSDRMRLLDHRAMGTTGRTNWEIHGFCLVGVLAGGGLSACSFSMIAIVVLRTVSGVSEMLEEQAREHREKMRKMYADAVATAFAAAGVPPPKPPTWRQKLELVRRRLWPWPEVVRSFDRLSDTSERCTDALCAALNELAESREAKDGPASDELDAALKSLSQYDPEALRRMTHILDSGREPFCACGDCENCGISALLASVLDAIADELCPELEPEELAAAARPGQSGESNSSQDKQTAPADG